jgi:hypothetical protein
VGKARYEVPVSVAEGDMKTVEATICWKTLTANIIESYLLQHHVNILPFRHYKLFVIGPLLS